MNKQLHPLRPNAVGRSELDAGDWVVRCLDCGVLNVITLPIFKLVG
jgi:hypothetical protein